MNPKVSHLLGLWMGLLNSLAFANEASVTLTPSQQEHLGIVSQPIRASSAVPTESWMAKVILSHDAEWMVTTPVAGVVVRILAEEGTAVTAQQPLVELSSPELPSLAAELARAQARLKFANSEYARDELLHREGIIPLRRKQASRMGLTEAEAEMSALKQRLTLLGVSAMDAAKGHITLTSQSDGYTLERLVRAGDQVQPTIPLLRLGDLNRTSLEIALPLNEIAPEPGRQLQGPNGLRAIVNQARPQVREGVQQQSIRAQVVAKDGPLVPGTWVSVHAVTSESDAWTIPRSAIVYEQGESLVFVARGDTFRLKPVSVLSIDADEAVIKGDVHQDDAVVKQGSIALLPLLRSAENP